MTPGAISAISLDKEDVRVAADATQRAVLKDQFVAHHGLLLRGFFAGDLLATIHRRLRHAPFDTRVAERVFPPAVDLKLRDDSLHGLLHFVVNDGRVMEFVREVTGAPEATGFVGAVYRLEPQQGHCDSWHSDVDGNRLVGLSVNLSERVFEGGELEMRHRSSEHPVWRVANTGPGDAILFEISPRLEHHIRQMAGSASKTAFAGWFCRDADLKL